MLINNHLKWDGTSLGIFTNSIFKKKWSFYGILYQELELDDDRSVVCIAKVLRDNFTFLIEDIKQIFGISHRKYHRLHVEKKEYIIYYVPVNDSLTPIFETPLNIADLRDEAKNGGDPELRKKIQKVIIFNDILALCCSTETKIILRTNKDGSVSPIAINENSTALKKMKDFDYTILSKTILNAWFDENFSVSTAVKEILQGFIEKENLKLEEAIDKNIIGEEDRENIKHNLCMMYLKKKIEEVIIIRDKTYIWYSYFIMERINRRMSS